LILDYFCLFILDNDLKSMKSCPPDLQTRSVSTAASTKIGGRAGVKDAAVPRVKYNSKEQQAFPVFAASISRESSRRQG
jgi:hypothetical protein